MPTLTEEIISLEETSISSPLTEEGMEVAIDDLLEDALSKPPEERAEYERKLQSVYRNTPFYQQLQEKIRAAAILGSLIEQGKAVVCEKCGVVYEIGEWPLCGTGFGRDHGRVTPRSAQTDTVTAYYVNRRTGKIWIPGRNQYRKPTDRNGREIAGYERHEVRNFRERDNFYRLMDNAAKKQYYSSLSREQQHFEPIFSENRKQARQDIISSESQSSESSYGREWLDHSIRKTEAEAAKKLNYNPNSHIEAWEFDRSNLDDANMNKLHETLNERQPVLSDKHKKAIGRAHRKNRAA